MFIRIRHLGFLLAALAILALGCTLPPVEQVVIVVTATPGAADIRPVTRTPEPSAGDSMSVADTPAADPAIPSATASSTVTVTDTSSATPTATASASATPTITSSNTATSTVAPTDTPTPSLTVTSTSTSTATSTRTPTPTRTPTRTFTPSATRTSTSNVPMAAADRGVDVNCRFGPGAEYAVASYFMKGQTSPVYGRSEWSTWVQIQDPRAPAAKCWVDVDYVTVSVPLAGLPVIPAPAGYVYSLTLALEEDEIAPGVCAWPVLAHFNYVIKVSGPAFVRYQITTSVTGGVVREKTFTSSGKIEEGFPLHLNAAGGFWVKVEIMLPNSLVKQVSGTVVCP